MTVTDTTLSQPATAAARHELEYEPSADAAPSPTAVLLGLGPPVRLPPPSPPRPRALLERVEGQILLPAVLFALLAACTVLVWRQKVDSDRQHLITHVTTDANRLVNELTSDLNAALEPLNQLYDGAAFPRRAREYASFHPDRFLLLAWADPNGVVRHVYPPGGREGNTLSAGVRLADDPGWTDLWGRTQGGQAGAKHRATHLDQVGGGKVEPICRIVAISPPDAPRGVVIAELRLQTAVSDTLMPGDVPEYLVELVHNVSGTSVAPMSSVSGGEVELAVGVESVSRGVRALGGDPAVAGAGAARESEWSLRLTPTAEFVDATSHGMPTAWLLGGGFGISALVAGSVFQALRHWAREGDLDRAQLQAIDALSAIAAGISARPGAGNELLEQCADASGRLLGMAYASICICEGTGFQRFRVAASRGFPVPVVGRVYQTTDTPLCRRCLETGTVVSEEDIERPRNELNREALAELSVRSTLMIPLKVGGRVIGLMVLADPRPWRFADRDLRLAELLGSHVAVIVANGRLYEQMSEMLRVRDLLIRQRDDAIRFRDESLRQRDESIRARDELMAQREQLATVTAAVYQAASLDESLKRIVELAPSALGVDVCTVDLIVRGGAAAAGGGAQMVVAAATAPFQKTIGKRFPTAGSHAERVIRERRMAVVEDAASDPGLHPDVRELMRVGSVVYIPLFEGGGRPLGMLRLIRHRPGKFSDEQLRLAQVFSTRAAAALENARLYQRSVRDAEAKAMLLRELNHRVKNNLAGIVGLLNSTRPSDLSPPAQQWLTRVTERINVMGRAHELFVGGPQRVELAALVDQVLPSLSIVRPAGVRVTKDLDGVGVALPTERAVALAMVLHELCYNAISHGLAGRDDGAVTIRARGVPGNGNGSNGVAAGTTTGAGATASVSAAAAMSMAGAPPDAGRVVVEVIDTGDGAHGVAPGEPLEFPTRRDGTQGWGLTLVAGLVTRELRGKFSLRAGDRGGTVASIEFPATTADDV